jgi:hypothetical protein
MAVKKKIAKGAAKAAPKKAGAKRAAAQTAVKAGTPKAKAAGKKAAKSAAPKKKAPAVKITDKQRDLLQKIHGSGEAGYGSKAEQKSIDSLHGKKLLKRGPKNKATGVHHYTVTKLGQKHLGAPAPAPVPPPASSAPAPTPPPAPTSVGGGPTATTNP